MDILAAFCITMIFFIYLGLVWITGFMFTSGANQADINMGLIKDNK